jgi:DNA-directed RNA polymerase subunit beta'
MARTLSYLWQNVFWAVVHRGELKPADRKTDPGKAGDIIDEITSAQIETAGIDEVLVRSVLTCEGENHGICGKCYGRDLARGTTVNMAKRSALWPRNPSVNRALS